MCILVGLPAQACFTRRAGPFSLRGSPLADIPLSSRQQLLSANSLVVNVSVPASCSVSLLGKLPQQLLLALSELGWLDDPARERQYSTDSSLTGCYT